MGEGAGSKRLVAAGLSAESGDGWIGRGDLLTSFFSLARWLLACLSFARLSPFDRGRLAVGVCEMGDSSPSSS